jgi:hypothetical protein
MANSPQPGAAALQAILLRAFPALKELGMRMKGMGTKTFSGSLAK